MRWKASGKRVKRGLYCSSNGSLINADCNGSANIIRKVSAQLNFDLTKACRAVLTLPKRYFGDSLSKQYRKDCEAARFQPAASHPLRIPVFLKRGEVNNQNVT
ncbi:hypothetical protein AFK68_03705 [Hydrocoleum sp. CS-953]|nr:hypothetical protein AFK68_23890 [Hydrocoleum sp. CS-953]OZH55575.1 hypothetical protein AFK68_03705 [Hydrocoleum sp. CS-953]